MGSLEARAERNGAATRCLALSEYGTHSTVKASFGLQVKAGSGFQAKIPALAFRPNRCIVFRLFPPRSEMGGEIGIPLPNKQHHTLDIQKDVLPYTLCWSLCPVSAGRRGGP